MTGATLPAPMTASGRLLTAAFQHLGFPHFCRPKCR
jgi:hypothetical protein